jgi:hypothetical protein
MWVGRAHLGPGADVGRGEPIHSLFSQGTPLETQLFGCASLAALAGGCDIPEAALLCPVACGAPPHPPTHPPTQPRARARPSTHSLARVCVCARARSHTTPRLAPAGFGATDRQTDRPHLCARTHARTQGSARSGPCRASAASRARRSRCATARVRRGCRSARWPGPGGPAPTRRCQPRLRRDSAHPCDVSAQT